MEFAILLPLLLSVALLCVDFGRFPHSYIAVTNAARVGASYGSTHPVTPETEADWQAGVRNAVVEELTANSWFVADDLTVSIEKVVDETDGDQRVRVEADYPFVTLINWPFLPGYNDPLELKRTVVMRQIR